MNDFFVTQLNRVSLNIRSLLSLKRDNKDTLIYAKKIFNKWYPTRKSFVEMLSNPSNDKIHFSFLGKRYAIPVSYRDKRNPEDKKTITELEPKISSLIKEEEDTIKEIIYESQLIPQSSNGFSKVNWDKYITPKILLAMSEQDIKWFSKIVRQAILICDCFLDRNDPLVIVFENEKIVHCSQMSDLKLSY